MVPVFKSLNKKNFIRHTFFPIVDLDAELVTGATNDAMEITDNIWWETSTNSVNILAFGILSAVVVAVRKNFRILKEKVFSMNPAILPMLENVVR